MNALVQLQSHALSAEGMREHVNRIQEVMQAVMKKDVHYGVIPGCKKPSLYKPGAEALCVTFHIGVSYRIEELPTSDGSIRYRVTAIGTHQPTSIFMGEGVGECWSNEEKYKWRRAYKPEYEATPETLRRVKQRKEYEELQVRAEPADCANTILKMACKRAHVAMTLVTLACADIFSQDIEDLPEHLRDEEGNAEPEVKIATPRAKGVTPAPVVVVKNAAPVEPTLSAEQITWLRNRLTAAQLTEEELCKANDLGPLVPGLKVDIKKLTAWCRNRVVA